MTTTTWNESDLTYVGWGLIGEPDGVLVSTAEGKGLDVTGYNAPDYWQDGEFLGPDIYGIVPVYMAPDGSQFPVEAKTYPYLA